MKLYNCRIELNLPVCANSPEEARELANSHWRNECLFPEDFEIIKAKPNCYYDNTWDDTTIPYNSKQELHEIWKEMKNKEKA